jgi:hypothetical protein
MKLGVSTEEMSGTPSIALPRIERILLRMPSLDVRQPAGEFDLTILPCDAALAG